MTEHVSATAIMDEKPLSPAARAGLVVNAAVTILLFYLTAILFMAGFTALALLLLLVTMAAARFGMASFVGRLLQVPVRLIRIFGRKLWLPSETTYRIALTREDAPDLFAIARALSRRSAVAPAESIFIEMHSNAWVMMRGYRRGTGRTTLGIGFDLLAGLTVTEVEAVLAHELAQARLEVLDEVVTRLPWSERLARLQPGEAFTAWLVNELTGPGGGDGGESLAHAVDPYSTHPALRDRVAAYGTLANARPPETQEQLAAAEEAFVAELRASAAQERTRRARFAMLVNTSYAALQERDYLHAHVAARLALELKKTSIEAGLAYAIAAAGLGNAQQAHSRLGA